MLIFAQKFSYPTFHLQYRKHYRLMLKHFRDASTPVPNNTLHTRLQEIIELLYKNNGQFPKGLPSQDQLKSILDHSYNCYDQLDFIILEYSKNSVNYLDPKIIAQSTHKIMRVTKYLFSNIRHWVQSYSVDTLRKMWSQKNHFSFDTNYQRKCSACSHFIEQIVIKQAKQEIFGHLQVRDLYEEELKEEAKEAERPQTPKESTEYLGSVHYLAKIIKEMEESAHGYQKLAQTIEKQDKTQDTAMKCIQELLSNLGKRLGQRYIYKLKKYIKSSQSDQQQATSESTLSIHKQYQQNFPPFQSKKKATDLIIKKLKQEVIQLQFQNKVLKQINNTTKNNLTLIQTRQQIQRTEMDRLTELINSKPSQKHSQIKQFTNSSTNLTQTNSSNRLTDGQKHSNRYSKFKVKKIARQSQAYSNATTLDLTYNNTNDQPSFVSNKKEETQDRFYSFEEDGLGMVSVGCQWQDLYLDQRHAKLKEISLKNSKLIKNSSMSNKMSTQMVPTIIEEVQQKVQSITVSANNNSNANKRSSKVFNLTKKSLQKNNRFSLEQNSTAPKKLQQHRQKTQASDTFLGEQTNKLQKTSLKVLQNEASTSKTNVEKINIYKNSKIRELNLSAKSNNKEVKGSFVAKQTQKQNQENRFSQQLKRIVSNRLTTQGSEQAKKRHRKIRNTIFKPEHLELFGGVSQSYTYEKSHPKQMNKLTQPEEDYLTCLKKYINNLSNFKNSLYDNVVMFLQQPFTLIEKNQIQFKQINERELTQLLNRLLSVHKNKCNSIQCLHLKIFHIIIGFI